MPWERVCTQIKTKKITAEFNISYPNEIWEENEFNSAKEFNIQYKEEYIWLNPYFFIILWLVVCWIFIIWLIFRKRKKRCINKKCRKKIDYDLKICPYCLKKQKKKKKNSK